MKRHRDIIVGEIRALEGQPLGSLDFLLSHARYELSFGNLSEARKDLDEIYALLSEKKTHKRGEILR